MQVKIFFADNIRYVISAVVVFCVVLHRRLLDLIEALDIIQRGIQRQRQRRINIQAGKQRPGPQQLRNRPQQQNNLRRRCEGSSQWSD